MSRYSGSCQSLSCKYICQWSVYANDSSNICCHGESLTAGGSQAHNNVQPVIAINYIIALQGLYPSEVNYERGNFTQSLIAALGVFPGIPVGVSLAVSKTESGI